MWPNGPEFGQAVGRCVPLTVVEILGGDLGEAEGEEQESEEDEEDNEEEEASWGRVGAFLGLLWPSGAVSKQYNGVPKVLTIPVDAPPSPHRNLQHGVRLRRSSFRLAHPVSL